MTVPPRPDTLDWDIGRGVRGYQWQAAEPRALMLLQHGYAEHARRYLDHYNRLIPHLVAMGITVHAIDLEGHGGSPGRRGATDADRAVEDHRVARRAMAADAPQLPMLLLGHSLGGLITAASVARAPDDVDGVVLSSPALLTKSGVAMRVIAQALGRAAPGLGLLRPQDPGGLSRIAEEVDAFWRDPAIYHGPMRARLAASVLVLQRELWTRTGNWNAPLLVIHGDRDNYADHRGSALFAGMVASKHKRSIEISKGRHELLNDSGRDDTLAFVLGWIDKALKQKP